MSERDIETAAEVVIDCSSCGKNLNGFNLWITGDKPMRTLCDECHLREYGLDDKPEE